MVWGLNIARLWEPSQEEQNQERGIIGHVTIGSDKP